MGQTLLNGLLLLPALQKNVCTIYNRLLLHFMRVGNCKIRVLVENTQLLVCNIQKKQKLFAKSMVS